MSNDLHVMSVPVRSTEYLSYQPQTNEERLLLASAKGELETVKQMLDAGVDIATPDTNGKIARLFISADWTVSSNSTPLHFACLRNQEEVAKLLLERAKKDNRDIMYIENRDRRIPFMEAMTSYSSKCVDLLLESGLDVRRFPQVSGVSRFVQDRSFGVLDNAIEMNPFIYSIFRGFTESLEKMLYFLGKEDAEKRVRPLLLPLLHSDVISIVFSYGVGMGDAGEFLNNHSNFTVLPLRLAKHVHKHAFWGQIERAKQVVDLLEAAGAKDQKLTVQYISFGTFKGPPPAKKHKTN